MAMNVGSDSSGDEEEVNSTINTTPLVDVMLVLLIIFLITIPVVTQSITLELPKERNVVTVTKPENILLAVSKDGDVYWNTHQIKDIDELVATLTEKAKSGTAAEEFKAAPRFAPRRRLDETLAARKPVLRWRPSNSFKEAAE